VGSVLVLGWSVVKAGMVDLFKRLSPGVLVVTTFLSLIVLSLVLRLLVSKMLLMVVMPRLFVVQIASPVTFNETLETPVDKVNVALTLDPKVAILVHLCALQSSHETFSNLRVFAAELSCSENTSIGWSCTAVGKILHTKRLDCFKHEI